MAHTPGPWCWRRGQIILNGSNVYEVNEICSPQGGSNPDDIRLMAAAPELLAACQRLMEYWGHGTPVDGGSEAADMVFAAVAKAQETGNAKS